MTSVDAHKRYKDNAKNRILKFTILFKKVDFFNFAILIHFYAKNAGKSIKYGQFLNLKIPADEQNAGKGNGKSLISEFATVFKRFK